MVSCTAWDPSPAWLLWLLKHRAKGQRRTAAHGSASVLGEGLEIAGEFAHFVRILGISEMDCSKEPGKDRPPPQLFWLGRRVAANVDRGDLPERLKDSAFCPILILSRILLGC